MLLHSYRCAVGVRVGRQLAVAQAVARQARFSSSSFTGGALCTRAGQSRLVEASFPAPLRWTWAARWPLPAAVPCWHYSSGPAPAKQSSTQRVKVVIKEYGGVAVVFHTVISLCSLGTCYLIVSRSDLIDTLLCGIDVVPLPCVHWIDILGHNYTTLTLYLR